MFFNNNKNFYKKSIKKYGPSPLGVQWKNKYTQYKRFEALSSFIKNDLPNSTIVDAGCGFGEYYNYLEQNNLLPKEYLGIDREREMILHAKKSFDGRFLIKNVLKSPLPMSDYYICSGALNTLSYKEIELFIKNMYEHSLKAVVLNYLKGNSLNGIHKSDICEIVKKYSSDITLKEDYLENDFTIFMRKS